MRIRPCISQRRTALLLATLCILHSSQRYGSSVVHAVEINDSKHLILENTSNDETAASSSQDAPSLRSSSTEQKVPSPPIQQIAVGGIFKKAWKRGLNGGMSGFIAGCVQVVTLMWLRTVINYQCRYGTTFSRKFMFHHRKLWWENKQGNSNESINHPARLIDSMGNGWTKSYDGLTLTFFTCTSVKYIYIYYNNRCFGHFVSRRWCRSTLPRGRICLDSSPHGQILCHCGQRWHASFVGVLWYKSIVGDWDSNLFGLHTGGMLSHVAHADRYL